MFYLRFYLGWLFSISLNDFTIPAQTGPTRGNMNPDLIKKSEEEGTQAADADPSKLQSADVREGVDIMRQIVEGLVNAGLHGLTDHSAVAIFNYVVAKRNERMALQAMSGLNLPSSWGR